MVVTGCRALLFSLLPVCLSAMAVAAPVPLLHITDLYHPHNDPDDHWDAATVYALAKAGRVRLLGVLIDYPLTPREGGPGGPAVAALAQIGQLSGVDAPMAVGSSVGFAAVERGEATLTGTDRHGVDFILDTLRAAPEPVVITVVGSCRDIALAGRAAPEVFREKCRGIYLNAGTGTFDSALGANREWNVTLDPRAYRAVFEIPCPIYWMPCFEDMRWLGSGDMTVGRYGSFWRFTQGAVFEALRPEVCNFFLYALTRSTDPRWLAHLGGPVDRTALDRFGAQDRNMWCTAGFLHLAGLTVTRDGAVVERDGRDGTDDLYQFTPIAVQLGEDGVAHWERDAASRDRFVFEVNDLDAYPAHMTAALRELLRGL